MAEHEPGHDDFVEAEKWAGYHEWGCGDLDNRRYGICTCPRRTRVEGIARALRNARAEMACRCQSCGELYREDVRLPDALWNAIRPIGKPEGAGLLCGGCIGERLAVLLTRAEATQAWVCAELQTFSGKEWPPMIDLAVAALLDAMEHIRKSGHYASPTEGAGVGGEGCGECIHVAALLKSWGRA